jgi:hypothetical protein
LTVSFVGKRPVLILADFSGKGILECGRICNYENSLGLFRNIISLRYVMQGRETKKLSRVIPIEQGKLFFFKILACPHAPAYKQFYICMKVTLF